METLKSTIIDLLRQEECIDVELSPFMNHIVIKLPDENNFDSIAKDLQEKIFLCVNKRLPHRSEDILFNITAEENEKTFTLPKQAPQ